MKAMRPTTCVPSRCTHSSLSMASMSPRSFNSCITPPLCRYVAARHQLRLDGDQRLGTTGDPPGQWEVGQALNGITVDDHPRWTDDEHAPPASSVPVNVVDLERDNGV